jgi:hypothetical protein
MARRVATTDAANAFL